MSECDECGRESNDTLEMAVAMLTAERNALCLDALRLETALQACAQRFGCETDGTVVVELDKVLAERDELRADNERLRR